MSMKCHSWVMSSLTSLSHKFAVDLKTNSGDDIAFYFNPRFENYSSSYVICNTRQEGK